MRIERFHFFSSVSPVKTRSRGLRPRTELFRLRTWLCAAMLAIFACTALMAQPKNYTKIVVFGDSLSDTGNVGQLVLQKYPTCGPLTCLDYDAGRITDGAYTIPAAKNYFGVWIEQLAAELPANPEILDSLNGGTNYSYAYATTGNGTSELCYVDCSVYSVEVENIGQQISDYLSTHPTINRHTLFVIWGGADNLLQATSVNDVINGAIEESFDIQRLIEAGATQILVPNLPPLGLTPRFNGSLTSRLTASTASALYNSYLAAGISILKDLYARKHMKIYQLDVFDLMRNVVAHPAAYSLTNVTDASQGDIYANPDKYLFWDDLHPTTRGHNILANAALRVLSH
jgi:phospholipase/lecithinase/hemolysin